MLFLAFCKAYLVVFSIYLAIPKPKNKIKINRRRRTNIINFDKVDKGKGGGGVSQSGSKNSLM